MAGISSDSLRHYERMKLLAPRRRSAGNYRLYPPEAVDRVRLIRHALAVGFSLPELAKILKVRDKAGAPCRQVKRLLEEKLRRLQEWRVQHRPAAQKERFSCQLQSTSQFAFSAKISGMSFLFSGRPRETAHQTFFGILGTPKPSLRAARSVHQTRTRPLKVCAR